jgi:hypothetical protein
MTCSLDTPPFRNSQRKPVWRQTAAPLALASWAVLTVAADPAAASRRQHSAGTTAFTVAPRPAATPIMAIVSLKSQGVTIYDPNGWIMRAPVSSGQTGRETPAGVYSVIEKDPDHHSNLYDDAWMPHMHRITWSGIALHGGPLPGYPASHGCIRLPYDFAARLFGVTQLGMRVIVAPGDVAPVDFPGQVLFAPRQGAAEVAAARAAEAAEAARKADQAKLAAVVPSREAAEATAQVRAAEMLKRKAEMRLAAADQAIASARSDDAKQKAEAARAQASADFDIADTHLTYVKTDQAGKLEAADAARKVSAEAEALRTATAEAARKAKRDLEPASVFISRKTQRLYVRQAFEPVLEVPITIRDPDKPIGTHVFTATARGTGASGGLQWTVVTLNRSPDRVVAETRPTRASVRTDADPAASDADFARAALDRITIPEDVADRIASMISPRSSVIVSDEPLSRETGKRTEFIVVLSGEPQGGIKMRRHHTPSSHHGRSYDGGSGGGSSLFGFPW